MSLIKNASPENINLGAQDLSTRKIPPERVAYPQHMPKFFIKAAKGSTENLIITPSKLPITYGNATIDKNGKYFNHQTDLLIEILGKANTCVVKRITDPAVTLKSNVVLYMDIVEAPVPNYVRNSLGEYVIDSNTNQYKIDATTPTVDGVQFKWITEPLSTDADVGMATSKAGTMSVDDGAGGTVTSTMYPVLEFKAKEVGEWYNNIGFGIESIYKDDVNVDTIEAIKSLVYNFKLYERTKAGATPVVQQTLTGEPYLSFTLKEDTINPLTEARMDLDYNFDNAYFNPDDGIISDYEGLYIYRNNLDLIYGKIMAHEKVMITETPVTWDDGVDASTFAWFDYTTADQTALDDETYLINIFTGTASKNIKYMTFVQNNDTANLTGNQKEVSIGKNNSIFLESGSDGDLSNTKYEEQVSLEMAKYADPNSRLMDTALNPESVIYDSGFTLATKKDLVNFIALRKDTILALSTHDATLGEKYLGLADIRAIAVTLKTRMKLAPESEYFGTPVARGIVVGGTGVYADLRSNLQKPLLYEIAVKSAKMMGAGNYMWKAVYTFDYGTSAEFELLKDIHPDFIPAGIKPQLWSDGLVWAQPKQRGVNQFPAIQTVYEDDTSVLNSWITINALATLTKIADDAWREFTGASTLADDIFLDKVKAYLERRLAGIFAGIVVVIPEVIMTESDKLRGYVWRVVYSLYSPNMKTKMISHTDVYRLSDLNK